VFIVAEIGNNHEGNFEVAQKLVRAAAESGVDAVKFQTFRTEHFVSHKETARFARLKSFELTQEQFTRLAELARSLGLLFMSTPLDMGSADFLAGLVDAFKIASGDNNFLPLIARAVESGKPVIISTGASDLEQVKSTVAFARGRAQAVGSTGGLAILHCVTSYPAPPSEVNLLAIPLLARELGCEVGYSDHTQGIDASWLSVAVGARIVEKHFTLDHHYSDFRDHQLSADPAEMRILVQKIREASVLLGVAEKQVQPSERPTVPVVRRSIVAARALRAGDRLGMADIGWVRPAGGLPPGEEHLIVGRTLRRDIAAGDNLAVADVET
jgi:N,N'-diacetyllegionaminate synthase